VGQLNQLVTTENPDLAAYNPSAGLEGRFAHWLERTGNKSAAALLVNAEATWALVTVQASTIQSGQRPASIPGTLLDLNQAAAYLNYKPAGLRKIVKRQQIQCHQNGRGPIKFRQEWLDDYIAARAKSPTDIERSPAQRRTRHRTTTEPVLGFDPSLYQS
jgi:hypothetical protein